MKKVFLLLPVVCVVLVEVYLRISHPLVLSIRSKPQYVSDSLLGFRYLPDSRGTILTAAYKRDFVINSHGFPGKEFSTKKNKNIYRIAIIGTSDDCGIFTDGDDYVSILECLLKAEGFNVEIINLSLDGSKKSIRNIRLASGELLNYQPNLVLLRNEFPLSEDIKYKYRQTYKGIEIKYPDPLSLDSAKRYVNDNLINKDFQLHLIDYCYVYRALIKEFLWDKGFKIIFGDRMRVTAYYYKSLSWGMGRTNIPVKILSVDESLKALKKVKSILAHQNTDMYVFSTYKMDDLHYDSLFNANRISYLHLDIPYSDTYTFGKLDGHSSRKGHRVIAEKFAEVLKKVLKPKLHARSIVKLKISYKGKSERLAHLK